MSKKQVIKQRKSFVKPKLKSASKEETDKVMELLDQNYTVNEIIDELEKLNIFKPRDLVDIKKHFEQIDLSDRLGK
jgi:hypothetical protein